MKNYLLIGGPADGRRVELPEFQESIIMELVEVFDPKSEFNKIERVVYKAHRIWAASNPVTVFVYGNMSLLDILTKLVEGYHRV